MANSAHSHLLNGLESIIPDHIAEALEQTWSRKAILALKLARMEKVTGGCVARVRTVRIQFREQTWSPKAGGWITLSESVYRKLLMMTRRIHPDRV